MSNEELYFENRVLGDINFNKTSSSIIPILSLNKLILFLKRHGNSIYLIYTLEDRVLYKKGKKATILEVLISETNYHSVKQLMEGKQTLYSVFDEEQERFRVGKIGNKVFPRKKVSFLSDISSRLPEPYVKLNGLPNSVNLTYQLKRLEQEERYYRKLTISDRAKIYEQKFVDNISNDLFYRKIQEKANFFVDDSMLIKEKK